MLSFFFLPHYDTRIKNCRFGKSSRGYLLQLFHFISEGSKGAAKLMTRCIVVVQVRASDSPRFSYPLFQMVVLFINSIYNIFIIYNINTIYKRILRKTNR